MILTALTPLTYCSCPNLTGDNPRLLYRPRLPRLMSIYRWRLHRSDEAFGELVVRLSMLVSCKIVTVTMLRYRSRSCLTLLLRFCGGGWIHSLIRAALVAIVRVLCADMQRCATKVLWELFDGVALLQAVLESAASSENKARCPSLQALTLTHFLLQS